MTITVAELLELPHLALEVLAGHDGLDVPVRWAHVAEVADPTPWLEGGELILTTGLGLSANRTGQVAYLRRLAEAQAAGLVVVRDSAPDLTPRLLGLADELAFPLIATLLKQPFRAIAETVFAANAGTETERLVDYLRIYGVVSAAAAAGMGAEALLARLGELTGMRLAVVRDDGRPQFGTGGPHPRWAEATASFAETQEPSRGLYARLPAKGDESGAYVLQLEAPWSSKIFLIAEGLDVNAMPDLVAVHHIATIMASQALAQRAERAVRQKLGAQLLHELLGDDLPAPHARDRLRALGLHSSGLTAIVLKPPVEHLGRLADSLHDGLLDRGKAALVGGNGPELVVVTALHTDEEDEEALGTMILRLTSSALGVSWPTGVGTPGSPGHLRTSYAEASIALAHAETTEPGIIAFARLQAPLAWLPADSDRLALLIDRTMGQLIAYDRQHGSDLVNTLRHYLRANRSPSVAARRLHLHRNTLAYRLRRIEALTGRSLDRMEDQVELWLALRAEELRGHPLGAAPAKQE